MIKETWQIIHKAILLLLDILVFTFRIVRKVILPTRRRKGNLLSSLLSFFVGLVEKVMTFEKSILRQPVLFRHKYVKRGLTLVVGFLFLLSSIEWTIGQSSDLNTKEPLSVTLHKQAEDQVTVSIQVQTNSDVQITGDDFFIPGFPVYKFANPSAREAVAFKKWLRYRVILI